MTQNHSFAHHIRAEREARGWAQSRLAEELGTDAKTVSRWELGKVTPAPYLREKLVILFGKSLQELGLFEPREEHPVKPPLPASFLFDTAIPLAPAFQLIGRDRQFAALRQRLQNGGNVGLSALNGLPGVGKTALSVALAHDPILHQHFQDGVLWAGLGPAPDMLGHLSRWGTLLGLSSSEMNALKDVGAWSLALRRAIGMRCMLLVIDDAWRLEDALALKIGGATCAHLITTRFPVIATMVAAEGATVLKELTTEEGLELLRALAPQVIEKEPVRARELVAAVGGLPLALTLLGNSLRIQAYTGQARRITAALRRFNDAGERLNLVEPRAPAERHSTKPHDITISLRSIISVSVEQLSEAAQAAFYDLAVFPSKPNSFSEEAAQAVAACAPETLDELLDTGLLQHTGADRYTLHQTIADYARVQVHDGSASMRLITYMTHFVEAHGKAYELLEIESQNILAALDAAFQMGKSVELIRTAYAVAPFLHARALYETARTHLLRAYQAAVARGQDLEQIQILLVLGEIVQKQGDLDQAAVYFQDGLALARRGGEETYDWTIRFLAYLGSLGWKRGEYAQAEQYLLEGLQLARQDGHQTYLYQIVEVLGSVYGRMGEYARAVEYGRESAALFRACGVESTEEKAQLAVILNGVGASLVNQNLHAEAVETLEEGLALAREAGHVEWTCALLNNLGDTYRIRREYERAMIYLREGLEIARRMNHREWLCVLTTTLGQVACAQGFLEQAEAYLYEGLSLAREVPIRQMAALALFEYGRIALARQNIVQAAAYFEDMIQTIPPGDQELEACADYGLAQVQAARGNVAEAIALGKKSVETLERINYYDASTVREWLTALQASPPI